MLVSSTKLNHINPLGNSQGEIGNSVFFTFSKVNNYWYNYHISVHDMTLYSHQLLSQNYFVKNYYILIF